MKTPLRYLLNPCDMERAAILAPIGDAIYWFYKKFTAGMLNPGDELPTYPCPCCLGMRTLFVIMLAFIIGLLI